MTTHRDFGNDTQLEKAEVSHAEVSHAEDAVASHDHQTTTWECARKNPKAILWALYANLGATLVGYENLALAVCLALPAFQMKFASEVDGNLIIPAYWQSLWNATYNIMQLFGSLSAGYVQDKLGRRLVFLFGIIIVSCGIAMAYLAETPAQFMGAKIISGFAVGAFQATSQTYVSEITPLPLRGIALSLNILMMNVGFLIAISTTYSRVKIMDESAFRVVFATAWVFPGILALGLPFLPESPYYLIMKNDHDQALKHLTRLSSVDEDLDARLKHMEDTVEAERRLSCEKASFLECFKGVNWRRTRIILICMYMPQIAGASLSSNAPYFLNQTGLSSGLIIKLMQIGLGVSILSSLVNIYLMTLFRQRPLMFFGMSICAIIYFIMGVSASCPQSEKTLLAIGIVMQFTCLAYGPAIGSSLAVAGEVSASRLRAKSQGIAFGFQALSSTVWVTVLPYMFNKDQGNMGGHIGWVFFGTRGRTFHELDTMFERKVSARHFEDYKDQ
ncbi:general substrate transporter [Fusarium flagelliforme]|uniref:general substrate transporter n=1 Tax=Fusarium flagelliforme TaxID=2675880 RepID=UPI001E8EC1FA|nr:general substrate transporter [Fusarium flagelliforme]KAH7198417.1 general substrate transporter [Fusarium flagelliforme]